MSLILVLAACSGGEPEVPAGAPTFHEDVLPLITENCRGCHTAGGAGPFALDTFEDTVPWAEACLAALQTGTMPPWMPDPECRDLLGARRVSPADIEMFAAWVEAGLPEGDPSTPPAEPDPPASFVPTHTLTGTGGYVSTAIDSDDYRCFVFDETFAVDQYMRGSQVTPGTPQVHHVLVYAVTADQVSGVQAADAADAEVGYSCFGGPFGDDNPDDTNSSLPIQIGSWVPGNAPALLGEDLSVRIPAGSRIVAQVHYSAVAGQPQPDQATAVQLLLQEAPTDFLATATPLPILSLDIPAGQSDVEFTQSFVNYDDEPIEIIAMAGHMHLLGESVSAWIRNDAGRDECGLDIPAWDFGWQGSYAFLQPVWLEPLDRIDVRCTYDNSEANQPVVDGTAIAPRDVAWGDGTLDEMCIVYVVKREPWAPTPDPTAEVCAGLDTCTGCDGDVDCALSCAEAGGTCGLCALESFETCSVASCGLQWLPVLDCIEPCVINAITFSGTVGDCMRDQCGDAAYEGIAACLQGTLEPGAACEGALDACR